VREIAATPDSDLGWSAFKVIFAISGCTATYDEQLYFLPLALNYLKRNPVEGSEFTSYLVYFLSARAAGLQRDGMLEGALREVGLCVSAWTAEFSVVHFDRDACLAKGWQLEHDDCVSNSDAVKELIDSLLRYQIHSDVAEELVLQWTTPARSPTAAAWLLEYARSERQAYSYYADHPGPVHLDMIPTKSNARIHAAITDEDGLRAALRDVAATIIPSTKSPTYWPDLVAQLSLSAA
jgi:hypothetical protein